MDGVALIATLTQELAEARAALAAREHEVACRESDLAECYRWTGADTDGSHAKVLAPYAVREVRDLRERHEASEAKVEALEGVLRQVRGYTKHKVDCDLALSTRELSLPCTCGLDALIGSENK